MKAIKAYVIFLIFLTILAITPVLAQPYNLASVNWVKYIKLSEGCDQAYGTCIFGDYLAVVGCADDHPSLVLLDRSTGYIVKKWVGEDYGVLCGCFSVEDALYAVSNWGAIYAFDKYLNLLNKAGGCYSYSHSSIAYDGEYLYIGGSVKKDIDGDVKYEEIWYIEKRTKSLELISYKELYIGNWRDVEMGDLGINPVTGELWAVGGYVDTSNKPHSLVVIFNKELRELKRMDYPYGNEYYLSWPSGICFDNIGNAYLGGYFIIAKLDRNGNILKVNARLPATKIAFIDGLVYVFFDVVRDNYSRHVLYILDSELNMIEEHVLSENVNAHSHFWMGRPCFDGKNVYVAGDDYALNKSRWVVYSITVRPLPPITVSIEGLPSSYNIPIYINGIFSDYFQGGESKEFNVSEIKVTVKIGQSEIKTYDTIYKAMNDNLTVNPGEKAVFRYYAKHLVCIDGVCNFYEKGSIISPKQDIPTLGGLIIKRFEGYIDSYGNNLGKSIIVNDPLTLSSAYREEINLPLLSIIVVVILIPLLVMISKIKIGKETGTIVKEAKGEEKTGTEVRELTKDELEKELATLNERLSRLEELYKKGEIDEEAYKVLKEEYENKKKELEKTLRS